VTLNAAQAVYVGDTQAVAVYLGDMLVWPTAPTPSGTPLEWTFDTDAAGWFDVNDPPDPTDLVTYPGTPAGWADGHAVVHISDQGAADQGGFFYYFPNPIHLKAGKYHIVAEVEYAPAFNFGTGAESWAIMASAATTLEDAVALTGHALETAPGAADWWFRMATPRTGVLSLDSSVLDPAPDSIGPSFITIPADGDYFFGLSLMVVASLSGSGAVNGDIWLNRAAVLDESGNVVRV
jgi:hypothetical protein